MFPKEVLLRLFSYLDVASLTNAIKVCRRWYECGRDQKLWIRLHSDTFDDPLLGDPYTFFQVEYQRQLQIQRNWENPKRYHEPTVYSQSGSFIRSVAIHENQIVTGTFEGSVILWENGNIINSTRAHTDQVCTVDIDEEVIVSGSGPPYWLDRNTVDSRVIIHTPFGQKILSDHRRGIRFVKLCKTRLATADRQDVIIVWNRPDFTKHCTLTGHKGWITGLFWIDHNQLISTSMDRTVRIWNLETGSCTVYPLSYQIRASWYHRGQLMLGNDCLQLFNIEHNRLVHSRDYSVTVDQVISICFDRTKIAVYYAHERKYYCSILTYSGESIYTIDDLTIFGSCVRTTRDTLVIDGHNFLLNTYNFT
jgi:WD40 repeat protein